VQEFIQLAENLMVIISQPSGAAALSLGAKGYGITPILLSSSIDFMRAEAALFGGTGTAKIHMLAGIKNHY
jgi:hypothetical protein